MYRSRTVLTLLFAVAALVACTKKENNEAASTGSAAVGSGSAATGSDTGSAGSGSAMAGSADTGSAGSAGSADTGSAGSADTGSAAAGSAAAGSGDAVVEFDKLSHDDKVKYMKTKVMPAMKAAFQKFDPKEFAKFTCKTCHGKDPQKNDYEMPTKDLPALDFEELKKGHDKEVAEFMANVVKPEMAKLLGEPEYSDANPKGFGCLHCHTAKK